ncbi:MULTISPECIES: TerB family tellurite resistance protein [Halomonas]|uniref:TerB family tellurite resistance protein n=2 Tax=Halomonas TaxID=2745 RepID=A0A7X4VY41_9GAMM|nr:MULTISPECIES: TerB family tellurite resistance protein [Halomonas]MDR5901987.1 TerB family tellurite resistance protein [Halomonas icarae]NAW12312.1 TerB family tellurite resistance protein [Halomonas icarae]TDB05397.1 TerB family tellurite resistance protein [Halomonas marinisediminis]
MLANIQRFFQQMLSEEGDGAGRETPSLELAAAALLCEVIRADYEVSPDELETLRDQLRRHLSVGEEAVDELMALAQQEVEGAVDHYQFVSLIKQHYDYPRRCELVRMMWALAQADGEQHHLEEHRIRQLAELLHVSHGDFIRAKIQVQQGDEDNGGG